MANGDKMTLAEFEGMVRDGSLVDYDGHGYYATKEGQSAIMVVPSDVKEGKIDKKFTHVVWFNK